MKNELAAGWETTPTLKVLGQSSGKTRALAHSVLFPNLQASFLTSKSSCRENVCSVCFVRVRCPQSASRGLNYTLTRIVHTLKKYLNYRCHDTRCSLAYRPQQHPREAIQATATTDGHYGIGFLTLLVTFNWKQIM